MSHHSGEFVNFTIRVDSGVLMLAKHRALLERTSVNQHLADALEDYADGTMDVARRTNKVVYVFGIVEEVRRMRRKERARRRSERAMLAAHVPPDANLAPYRTPIRAHEYTTARDHESTPGGREDGSEAAAAQADRASYQALIRAHEYTTARDHESTPEGREDGSEAAAAQADRGP